MSEIIDENEVAMVMKALVLLQTAGYDTSGIGVRKFASSTLNPTSVSTFGDIYLSESCFTAGQRAVERAILEEYLYLKQELSSCSRELQNFLLDKVLDEMAATQEEAQP